MKLSQFGQISLGLLKFTQMILISSKFERSFYSSLSQRHCEMH